jgi:hypothetical protein
MGEIWWQTTSLLSPPDTRSPSSSSSSAEEEEIKANSVARNWWYQRLEGGEMVREAPWRMMDGAREGGASSSKPYHSN